MHASMPTVEDAYHFTLEENWGGGGWGGGWGGGGGGCQRLKVHLPQYQCEACRPVTSARGIESSWFCLLRSAVKIRLIISPYRTLKTDPEFFWEKVLKSFGSVRVLIESGFPPPPPPPPGGVYVPCIYSHAR